MRSFILVALLVPMTVLAAPRKRTTVLPAAVPISAPAAAASTTGDPATKPEKLDEDASIVVTVRHMNGEKETFSKEVDVMDLVFDPNGRLTSVHMVLFTNGEKDTHRWYLLQNLASFTYRFLNVSGKGKVRLQMTQPFVRERSQSPDAPEVPALVPRDYR